MEPNYSCLFLFFMMHRAAFVLVQEWLGPD